MKLSYFISNGFRKGKDNSGFVGFFSKTSAIGIAIGVAVLIVALSVINGFEQQLKDRLLGVIPHIEFNAPGEPIQNWPSKVALLETHNKVIHASPYIKLSAMAQHKTSLKAVQVKAIVPASYSKVSRIGEFIPGDAFANLDVDEVVLGRQVARSLGVDKNDVVTLLLPNTNSENVLSNPIKLRLKVTGYTEMGGPIDQFAAFVHLQAIQEALDYAKHEVTGLQVLTSDVFGVNEYALLIGQLLPDYVYIETWYRSQGNLYQDIQMVRTIVFITVFLIIAVSSFNIVSTLIMEVKEKQANIAILKTMGAKDSTIITSFIFHGLYQAGIGIVVGTVLGVLVALNVPNLFEWYTHMSGNNVLEGIYFVEFLPSKVQAFDIVIVVIVTIILALAASVYPALKAARIEPAKVLGH